jgi:hypothetical protein
MQGAATQAMPLCIVEERQRRRCPPAAAPLWAEARRPAGCVARSLHTTPGMLVARALPAGLRASAKCKRYSLTGPKCRSGVRRACHRRPHGLRTASVCKLAILREFLSPFQGLSPSLLLYPGLASLARGYSPPAPAGAESQTSAATSQKPSPGATIEISPG